MSTDTPPYLTTDLPFEERARDLVSRMTLSEKISQMIHRNRALPHLGVDEYNWWNECLHGVARAGVATVFPQAIGMAASWNTELLKQVGNAISDEARAKHHEAARLGDRDIYKGLTFWSPNINIVRDPRWGRGHETYGEDPYLTGEMACAFIAGLQGDDSRYLKVAANAKHFVVHSGPENERHRFNAEVSVKDLRETYLPHFKACVVQGKVASVMSAYNRTNGEPCTASRWLLHDILREEWGFDGYVVSDCGAVYDIHEHHKLTTRPSESAAMAVTNGCDLNCGEVYLALKEAVNDGLLTEGDIDRALIRLVTIRMRLGMFDPPDHVPYAQIPYEVNDCDAHRALSRKMARQSLVLLKNTDNMLPLSKNTLRSVAVIGPNADSRDVLLANYFGTPSRYTTVLNGIRTAVSPDTRVWYAEGSLLVDEPDDYWAGRADRFLAEAVAVAERADVAIVCLGLSPRVEGEEGDVANSDGGGDRIRLDLYDSQQRLLKAVHATGTPTVLVLLNGSAIAINWADDHIPAILEAWYPGAEGGHAIADVLFGDVNPGGRLPVTFVRSLDDLPPFTDYAMHGRTYRYFDGEPLYPFGYGLSYTQFRYKNLRSSHSELPAGETLTIQATVVNIGNREGDEVVQLYVTDVAASVTVPKRDLRGFQRLHLEPGERQDVTFSLSPRQLALIDDAGNAILEPGEFTLSLGGRQPDARSAALTGSPILSQNITVTGERLQLPY